MREAGQRAGFDHIAAANYFLRRAELAVWQADAAAARHYVMRGGVYAESRIADWVTQLRLVLALEGNRAEEFNELVATVDSRSTALSDDGCPTLLPVMLAARRGDRVAALAAFNDMAEQPKMVKSHTGGDFLMAAESALAAGVPEEAVLAARDRIAFAQKSPELVPTLRAIIAASRSDHEEVIAQLDEIPSALDTDIPVPLLASAHVILARALASHRRTVDARQHATVARQLLERWPGWRRDEADALLQRLEAASQQARRRADAARARGRCAGRRRADELRTRQAPVHLAEDRRGARVQHPHETRDREPRRDRRLVRAQQRDRQLTPFCHRARRLASSIVT